MATRHPPDPRPSGRGRPHPQHSFGLYRLEILAAPANSILLLGVAAWVLVEAVRRLADPAGVEAGPTLAVAVAGLLVNLLAGVLLRGGAAESLNIEGAYLEVVADALGSVGVVVAGLVLVTTGWPYADPLVAAGIGVLILPRTLSIARRALHILVQAAPAHVPVEAVRADLSRLDDVVGVHDLHVWTLTGRMDVASAHLMVREGADAHAVLDAARDLLMDDYGIDHATLQVEPETHEGCQELTW